MRIKYNLQNVNYIKKIKNIKNNISICISSDFEEHLDEKIDAIKNTNNYCIICGSINTILIIIKIILIKIFIVILFTTIMYIIFYNIILLL